MHSFCNGREGRRNKGRRVESYYVHAEQIQTARIVEEKHILSFHIQYVHVCLHTYMHIIHLHAYMYSMCDTLVV